MIKCLHVLCGVVLWGLTFASCFYVTQAKKKRDELLYAFTVKLALQLEMFVILPALLMVLLTGSVLVVSDGFSFSTPWIVSAYILLSMAFFLRMFILRCLYYRIVSTSYYLLNAFFWGILFLIVHDAIVHPLYYFWQIGVGR